MRKANIPAGHEVAPSLQLFSIYDSKLRNYRKPLLAMSEWEIARDYERMCREISKDTPDIITNAEDFQLFRVGYFSNVTGQVTSMIPEHVFSFHEIRSSIMAELSKAPQRTIGELRQEALPESAN